MSILLIRNMKSATLILLFAVNFAVNAQTFRGGEIFHIKDSDVYWAAVKTEYFVESVAIQEEDNWCWAACVQMVLSYQGVKVDQDEIVQRAFGARINKGGTAYDIERAANGWKTGSKVICARVDNPYFVTPQTFINDLSEKYPLIVGLEMPGQMVGHAYVLTGISFQIINGISQPLEVILRNPWPSSPSKEKLPWHDFRRRVHTIVHIFPK